MTGVREKRLGLDTRIPHPSRVGNAACAGLHPKVIDVLFFPKSGTISKGAGKVCRPCPVREACATWAVVASGGLGVWAGQNGKHLFNRDAAHTRGFDIQDPARTEFDEVADVVPEAA